MGAGQNFLTRVKSATSGFGKCPLKDKYQIFNFFPIGSKEISMGRVKKYLGQSHVGLLFTVGQKYAWVRSETNSTQNPLA